MVRWRRRLVVLIVMAGSAATVASLRKRLLDRDEAQFRASHAG